MYQRQSTYEEGGPLDDPFLFELQPLLESECRKLENMVFTGEWLEERIGENRGWERIG